MTLGTRAEAYGSRLPKEAVAFEPDIGDTLVDAESWYPNLRGLIDHDESPLDSRHASLCEAITRGDLEVLQSSASAALSSVRAEAQTQRIVEKYRATLNGKFQALQECMLASKILACTHSEEDRELLRLPADKNGSGALPRQAKSLVLQKAIGGIKLLEGKCKKLTTQIRLLESTIQALQMQMNGMLG